MSYNQQYQQPPPQGGYYPQQGYNAPPGPQYGGGYPPQQQVRRFPSDLKSSIGESRTVAGVKLGLTAPKERSWVGIGRSAKQPSKCS